MTHRTRRNLLYALLAALGGVPFGCHSAPQVPPRQWLYVSPYPGPRSLAVTVFLNQSGSAALDPMVVTDEFYTELQQIPGLEVVPVNRVLATMDQLGLSAVRGPDEAVLLADALGVDGVIVGAVTRYDPYWPPLVGMAVQLYGRSDPNEPGVAPESPVPPWELSRMARPFRLGGTRQVKPQAMVVRIYDAARDETVARLKRYSALRGSDETPFGWRKQATRRSYLRFVAHEIIGELLAQEQQRLQTP